MTTIVTLAEAFRDSPHWHIPEDLKRRFASQVDVWYDRIPLPIRYLMDTETGQPFMSTRAMKKHCDKKGELLMLSQMSQELGRELYQRHRAVHDWFGHCETGDEFGAVEECYSFIAHMPMYSPDVLPIVFSDVVLLNCYADSPEIHGDKPIAYEKWVKGGPELMQYMVNNMPPRVGRN